MPPAWAPSNPIFTAMATGDGRRTERLTPPATDGDNRHQTRACNSRQRTAGRLPDRWGKVLQRSVRRYDYGRTDGRNATRNGDGDAVSDDADVGIDSDAFGVDGDGTVASTGELDTEFEVGESASTPAETTGTETSRVGRVKRRAGSVFSPTTFVLQLGAALVGAFVLGNLIPLIPFAGFSASS